MSSEGKMNFLTELEQIIGGGGGDFPIWNWGWRAENNFRDGKISLDIT